MQYNDQMRFAVPCTLMVCVLIVPHPSAADGGFTAEEGAVLKSDAAWAAAANTGNVDAWVAFCAAEAIVILPHEPLASGAVPVRGAVTHFMGLAQLAVHWQATGIEMAPTGDLARVLGTYELERAGAGGALGAERGTRLDIWRKQADGSWKAIVDSWNAATNPGNAAATTRTPGSDGAPATATVIAKAPAAATRYGDAPVNYLQAIRQYFQEHLKDPESLQYGEVTPPEQGSMKGISGAFLMSDSLDYGWIVKAEVNARNSSGRYVGYKKYQFLFRGEKLVRAAAPLPEGEMN